MPLIDNQQRCTLYAAAPETLGVVQTPYDMRAADVNSIGASLLAMLLGCHPFSVPQNYSGDVGQRTILMKKDRNLIRQLLQPFDYRLQQLLMKVLEPLPNMRISIDLFLADDWFTHGLQPQELEPDWRYSQWKGLPQEKWTSRRHSE